MLFKTEINLIDKIIYFLKKAINCIAALYLHTSKCFRIQQLFFCFAVNVFKIDNIVSKIEKVDDFGKIPIFANLTIIFIYNPMENIEFSIFETKSF